MTSPESVTRVEPVSQRNPDLSQPCGSPVQCTTTGDFEAKTGTEPVSQCSSKNRGDQNCLTAGSLAQTAPNGRKSPASTQYTGEPPKAISAGSSWLSWLTPFRGPKWT